MAVQWPYHCQMVVYACNGMKKRDLSDSELWAENVNRQWQAEQFLPGEEKFARIQKAHEVITSWAF
jgi:hypothetical protein